MYSVLRSEGDFFMFYGPRLIGVTEREALSRLNASANQAERLSSVICGRFCFCHLRNCSCCYLKELKQKKKRRQVNAIFNLMTS